MICAVTAWAHCQRQVALIVCYLIIIESHHTKMGFGIFIIFIPKESLECTNPAKPPFGTQLLISKFQFNMQDISFCSGSRAGAIIAACWATMMYMGLDGYVDATRKIIKTTRYITEKLRNIDGIFIYGEPEVSVIGIGTDRFNVYRLSDALSAKGWNLNSLQYPNSVHLCCTLLHTYDGVADRFIKDVSESVKVILKQPKVKNEGQAAMYGMAQSIPDRSLVSDMVGIFFDAYYSTESKTGSQLANGTSNGKH